MTDPAQIPLAALEIGVRGVAVGAFAATAVALGASRKMTPTRWVGVLLMACAIAHVIDSHFFYTESRHHGTGDLGSVSLGGRRILAVLLGSLRG